MTWSSDGTQWWDGGAWRPVGPDGRSYWNGAAWVPIPMPPGAVPTPVAPMPQAPFGAPTPMAPIGAPMAVSGTKAPMSSGTKIAIGAGVAAVAALLAVAGVLGLSKKSDSGTPASALQTGTASTARPTARPTATPRRTPVPTPEPTSEPTAPPSSGNGLSGLGDTTSNPDSSYLCAFEVLTDDHATVIAYATVAGPGADEGKTMCDNYRSSNVFREVQTLTTPKQSTCYRTEQDGAVTTRIYQAPSGSASMTDQLCTSFLNG